MARRKKHNPAGSASQYGAAQAVLSGASSLMPRQVARELIDATPERLRKKFARELAARRKHNPKRHGRRRKNQETADVQLKAAERMYTKFHGRKPKGHSIVEQARVIPSVLSDLGKMIELEVRPLGTLKFNGTGVRLGVTGEGGQLYFVKGDQSISLAGIPHKGKDHVDLGFAHKIVYLTSKDFHNFEPSEYVHRFGEEDRIRPTAHYDVRSKRLYLTGGNYQVRREGIVN